MATRRDLSRRNGAASASGRAERARRRRLSDTRRARAVTLIELLIVLGLLVAIAALALPTTLETLARRQFESDVDSLLGQLRLARNHARTTASAVEVMVAPDGEGTIRVTVAGIDVRDLARDALAAEEEGARHGVGSSDRGDKVTSAAGAGSRQAIVTSWADARYQLSIDDRVDEDRQPAAGGATGRPNAAETRKPGANDLEAPAVPAGDARDDASSGPRRIALFVADGGAPIAARLVVHDAGGRSVTIVINPWTGLASTDARGSGAAPAAPTLADASTEELEASEPPSPGAHP